MVDQISKIFRAAGVEPLTLDATRKEVSALEQRLARKIPRRFREFILCTNSSDFLYENSNHDRSIALSNLGEPIYGWENYDPVEEDQLLPFMIENQGVCTWAVGLDGSDDPVVFIEVDSGSPPKWQRMAETFTSWLKCQVEDKILLESAVVAAQAPPLTDDNLKLLQRNFEAGDETFAWPASRNYRFTNKQCRLLLWAGEDQCDWWISPAPGVDLSSALDELGRFSGLSKELYTLDGEHDKTLKDWISQQQTH